MRGHCRFIVVLLVEAEVPRVLQRLLAYIEATARLLACKLLHLAPEFLRLLLGARTNCVIHNEYQHYFAAAFLNAPMNSGAYIVWSRSGPVDTMPVFAPVSVSTNLRYSCVRFGNFSNCVIPDVVSRH